MVGKYVAVRHDLVLRDRRFISSLRAVSFFKAGAMNF